MTFILVLTLPNFAQNSNLKFAIVSDMQFAAGKQYFSNGEYFDGVCSAMFPYNIDFIVSCGDNCPPDSVRWTIDQVFHPAMAWYPCMGNHEMESFAYQDILIEMMKQLPDVQYGFKPSVYSFDRGHVHFSVIDVYQKNNDADIYDELYRWLEVDLQATQQPIKLVIGHEPAFVLADEDCGRMQYQGECLDQHSVNRNRFWKLLQQCGVLAYFCGHTHNYSARLIDDVWQINCGHSRGKMEPGAPSTFLIVDIVQCVTVTAYRDEHDGNYDYQDIVRSFDIKIMNKEDNDAPGAPVNLKIFEK